MSLIFFSILLESRRKSVRAERCGKKKIMDIFGIKTRVSIQLDELKKRSDGKTLKLQRNVRKNCGKQRE